MSVDDLDLNAREAFRRTAEIEGQKVVSTLQLKRLDASLEAAVTDLRGIGWGFRACFLTDMDYQPTYKKFQEGILHEACIFKEGMLLIATCILCHIKRFFRNYIDLAIPMWKEKIESIAGQAEENGTLCALLACWYKRLADDLRKRAPDAEAVRAALIFNTKQYAKNMQIVKMRLHVNDHLLAPLMFVPEVGRLAAPFAASGDPKVAMDFAKSYEAKSREDIGVAAAEAVSTSLIPVVDRFVAHVIIISEVLLKLAKPLREIKPDLAPSTAEEFEWKKTMDQYIKDNGLVFDDAIRSELNAEPMHIQKIVIEKGPVKGEEDPAGELRKRIRTAKMQDFSSFTDSLDKKAKAKAKGKGKPAMQEEEVLSPEEEALDAKRMCHYEAMSRQSAHRVSNWCDDLVSLDPLFDYDMEFVPAYKMKEKGYVDQWIDESTINSWFGNHKCPLNMQHVCGYPPRVVDLLKSHTGELIADVVRDVTTNAEILLALPR